MKVCLICGNQAEDVEVSLARYLDRDGVQAVDRCGDRAACRQRVEAAGRKWLLDDPIEEAA